ncbi:MAG: hypothetical protein F4X92_05600 [Gammaproteobacteria bacterium]|nr:hypothetical protein [Gammaproteobacteria bacterium]
MMTVIFNRSETANAFSICMACTLYGLFEALAINGESLRCIVMAGCAIDPPSSCQSNAHYFLIQSLRLP